MTLTPPELLCRTCKWEQVYRRNRRKYPVCASIGVYFEHDRHSQAAVACFGCNRYEARPEMVCYRTLKSRVPCRYKKDGICTESYQCYADCQQDWNDVEYDMLHGKGSFASEVWAMLRKRGGCK
jgi:hypothetical protein